MRYKGRVYSVTFSPDGELLASGSYQIAVVWELSGGRKIAEFQHDDWVTSIAFSPDGKFLATGSQDATAVVWELPSGKKLAEFLPDSNVDSVAFSPDGKYLATTVAFSPLCVWEPSSGMKLAELSSGKELAEFPRHEWVWLVAFNPDGKYLAYSIGGNFQVAEWKKRKCIRKKYNEDSVRGISWFKRMPAYRMKGILSPFAILPGKYTWDIGSMCLSRRGFMAIGYTNGTIEVIRE